MAKKGLGKGLSALIPDVEEEKSREVTEINLKDIKKNPYQPRKNIDDEKLKEMLQSIREHGVIQPVLVRKVDQGYELVAGERRMRAAQLARLEKIPAVIRDFNDNEMLEISLIENIQRENLSPLEEAEAYKRLMDEFGFNQGKIAERLGKSRPVIANTLRLLNLEEKVKDYLKEGKISAGHARALVSIEDMDLQREVADEILKKNLTVRKVEGVLQQLKKKREKAEKEPAKKPKADPFIRDLEEKLCRYLGTKVKILEGKNKGKIEIEYYNPGELERITEKLFNL
ncbi:MAG: ParB/RepB/Spo0J family partition protein [Candidatus Syntrophonatronum acetioxidans]|uniref:ParB/RepB/Spo0J family partition protein n=1 Tax=Candidatus Syntrophonatronum acetioxidans TaxID=1795816 RepID=A0A424YB50_9FIRM|nr:MAG: ParB/RepB/Spo0J family partition protein [Candidatus Syntrophonatronum acetioxidans]